MKKTMVSLAAASLIATSAMAADKGVDITTTGQAVVYYQTVESGGDTDYFAQGNSGANVGVQLNLGADLGNDFTFGSQISYLGTAGLEHNLVSNVMQTTNGNINMDGIADEVALTKVFVAKKVGNTTLKIGRQELPKSLSPFAFSEGWNVYKNTFEAILAVNSDIPDTTLVGAYVGASNSHGNLGNFNDLMNGAYMLTAQNKSVPMATITASYYRLTQAADVIWGDVSIAGKDLPLGLKVGIQGGTLSADAAGSEDTVAMGAKVSVKPVDALTVIAAFTTVNDGTLAVHNYGTGVKTPLYTQMVANQGSIKSDNDTIMVKAAYSLGDAGKVILQGSQSTDNTAAENDLTDLELLYIVKSGGVKYLAAYVTRDYSNNDDAINIVRVWARYAF